MNNVVQCAKLGLDHFERPAQRRFPAMQEVGVLWPGEAVAHQVARVCIQRLEVRRRKREGAYCDTLVQLDYRHVVQPSLIRVNVACRKKDWHFSAGRALYSCTLPNFVKPP